MRGRQYWDRKSWNADFVCKTAKKHQVYSAKEVSCDLTLFLTSHSRKALHFSPSFLGVEPFFLLPALTDEQKLLPSVRCQLDRLFFILLPLFFFPFFFFHRVLFACVQISWTLRSCGPAGWTARSRSHSRTRRPGWTSSRFTPRPSRSAGRSTSSRSSR